MNSKKRQLALFFMAADSSQKLRSALEFGVVVTIVMLLTAFATRSYEPFVIRAQLMEAYFLASTIKTDLVTYRAQYGQWPDNKSDVLSRALSQEHALGRIVDHFDLHDSGLISAVFGDTQSDSRLSGRQLTFVPVIAESSPTSPVFWACSKYRLPNGKSLNAGVGTTIEAKYLPLDCREY